MVIFRISENINIKTTDGTLVKYNKLKNPSNLFNETVYISTFEDFSDLKRVFLSVGSKYKARVIDEQKIRTLSQFPKELGISNINEYLITQNLDFKYKKFDYLNTEQSELKSLYLNEKKVDLDEQLYGVLKEDITIAILGNLGNSLSSMICACTALRLLYEKLIKQFKSVKLDIYLNASENKFFTRDKMLFLNQSFINKVSALSLNVKELCEYDFFIDTSSVFKRSYFEKLSYIDSLLYKFGIDYTKIPIEKKYNTINISAYKPKTVLKKKLATALLKGKVLLYHPYSANIEKSIPKDIAISLLKDLLLKLPDYTIVSALKLEGNINDDRFLNLSAESKNFLDYAYIVSKMDKIITVNTATYHLADAFFIPTVTILTNPDENFVQYPLNKTIYIEDKSKNFSNFIFESESLVLYRFDGFSKLTASKIIKLLETF
jgi:ADP-heptose:LPS heptosyltransferase